LFLPELQTALEYKNHHSRKKQNKTTTFEREEKMTKEKSKSVAIFFCSCRLPLLDLFKAFRNAFQWQKQDLSKGFDIAFSDILLCTISYTQTTYLHTIRVSKN